MTATLPRIDPASIPALYDKHGVTPICRSFMNDDVSCGCLLTILAVEKVGREGVRKFRKQVAAERLTANFASLLGLDTGYAEGLLVGWDDEDRIRSGYSLGPMPNFSPEKNLGIEDGRIAYHAVFREPLAVEVERWHDEGGPAPAVA